MAFLHPNRVAIACENAAAFRLEVGVECISKVMKHRPHFVRRACTPGASLREEMRAVVFEFRSVASPVIY